VLTVHAYESAGHTKGRPVDAYERPGKVKEQTCRVRGRTVNAEAARCTPSAEPARAEMASEQLAVASAGA